MTESGLLPTPQVHTDDPNNVSAWRDLNVPDTPLQSSVQLRRQESVTGTDITNLGEAGHLEENDATLAWCTATLADMHKLQYIIGEYLLAGMKASRVRRREEDMGQRTLTNAMRLRPARTEGGDFWLEIWLCVSVGEKILEARMRSFEDLKRLLGDYLFEAVKASNKRKEEEKTEKLACTNAVDVYFYKGDSRLKIMLTFEVGMQILLEAFPS